MTNEIVYQTYKGGNATYADISDAKKQRILNMLQYGLNRMVEASNFRPEALDLLKHQDQIFRKHLSSGNHQTYNSLGSFCAGVLNQHLYIKNRGISVKQLAGIEFAVNIFIQLFPEDNNFYELQFTDFQDLKTDNEKHNTDLFEFN